MFFYDIVFLVSCFVVLHFNARRLVSFNIFFLERTMSHFKVQRIIKDLKEMKRIKNRSVRYVFYPNLFIISIIHYLKQNFKEVSVHLSLNYLESRGKNLGEISSCLEE